MSRLKQIGLFGGPLFALILWFLDVGADPFQTKVLAVAAWMLVWWITEAVVLYVTAMLPMVLFPILGIMDVTSVFQPYANPIIFLFLGGFILALALEERKLHERIAYGLLQITGTNPRSIIFGIMASTALVAMWISNTATAVMMLPIGLSIIQLMEEQVASDQINKRFAVLVMLGIAYSANIGGMMTLIGTPPNLVFAGFYFDAFGTEFTFFDWLKIGVPIGLALLLSCYLLLTRLVFPIGTERIEGVEGVLKKRWLALGKINRSEALTLMVFGLTVALWVFNVQINDWLGQRLLNNTSIAMLGGILMFVVPVNLKEREFIISWQQTNKIPWGILILFGGGLCLADALEKAGIITLVANWVASRDITSDFSLMIGLTLIALLLTEVMSNVALVTVLLPVVFGISDAMGLNPLLLTIPVTLAASCAFMMPISTPPNAVVFSSGRVGVSQMLRAGIWMNLISILIITVICFLYFS